MRWLRRVIAVAVLSMSTALAGVGATYGQDKVVRIGFQKYGKLVMIFPGGKEPEGRMNGFQRFCDEKGFQSEIIRNVLNKEMKRGEAYFVPSDRNLVRLVKMAAEKNLQLGKDVGIVSFNDTVLKEVVAGGITTISTDFQVMGQTLARMIQDRSIEKIRNQSSLIRRNSL